MRGWCCRECWRRRRNAALRAYRSQGLVLERSFPLDGWVTPVMVALVGLTAADDAVRVAHLPFGQRVEQAQQRAAVRTRIAVNRLFRM